MLHLAKAATRPIKASELFHANHWAVDEGWNPGPSDALVFGAADPGSLLTVEANGVPAGVISAVRMTPDFGFVGFFVLGPEYRRSLYGWRLVQASLERMSDRSIGADGVLERVHTYAHYGFSPYYHTISYHGMAPLRPAKWRAGVELASRTPLTELASYDAMNFGVSRAAFLREWLVLPDSCALVFKRDGRVCGLGAARRCHRGVRIGPLQADDPEAAESLFDALLGFAPGEEFSVDSPEPNLDARKLLRRKGMIAGLATARLYRGAPPNGIPNRVYGLMSFALG